MMMMMAVVVVRLVASVDALQVFFKTSFPQLYQTGFSYSLESGGSVMAEAAVDFSRHYSFRRGEPIPFTARLTGRLSGQITGEIIFDGVPVYFQVRSCRRGPTAVAVGPAHSHCMYVYVVAVLPWAVR